MTEAARCRYDCRRSRAHSFALELVRSGRPLGQADVVKRAWSLTDAMDREEEARRPAQEKA